MRGPWNGRDPKQAAALTVALYNVLLRGRNPNNNVEKLLKKPFARADVAMSRILLSSMYIVGRVKPSAACRFRGFLHAIDFTPSCTSVLRRVLSVAPLRTLFLFANDKCAGRFLYGFMLCFTRLSGGPNDRSTATKLVVRSAWLPNTTKGV